MKKSFNYFTLSIFDNCNFEQFLSTVNLIKKPELENNMFKIQNTGPCIDDFFNPRSGGAHFPIFCFWENNLYPNKVFFISNYEDGLYTLCNVIHRNIKGNMIMCSLSNEQNRENPSCQFHYSDSNCVERHILAYKEDKWVFHQEGVPLSIENIENYNRKLIKQRLNNSIIEEYLGRLGIDLWNVFDPIGKCLTYIQKAWP